MNLFRHAGSPKKISILLLFALSILAAPAAFAQSQAVSDDSDRLPVRGTEMEAWTGGGFNFLPGSTYGISQWTAGLRYGWILTGAHGRGFIRGRFEYAVDALPVVMVFEPGGPSYGFGFDPWIMKWNFETHRRISPYIEVGGGALISTREIPLGESRFNFTPTGAVGVNILRGKYHWSIDFRYFHMSDSALTPYNPGTDTFGLRIGWGTFIPAK